MPLSDQAVNRLFDRLTATYGRDFTGRWEGLDAKAVKSSWAHELEACGQCLHVIAWALENLPEKPPNVIEFRALCRRAPATELPRLEAPPADPARLAAELTKLRSVRDASVGAGTARGGWAQAIVARVQAGDRSVTPGVADMARSALGRSGAGA